MPYSSALDCAAKTLTAGGPLKFYTGFPTYIVRCVRACLSLGFRRPPTQMIQTREELPCSFSLALPG
jgi:hypothetical protein